VTEAADSAAPPRVPLVSFWMGAFIALAAGLPLVCLALYLCALAGVGDPGQPVVRVARLALAFAGLPAFLTGGGVARLAAHRALGAPIGQVGPRAMRAAVPAMAAGGAALAFLVAVPLGGMPDRPWPWLWLAVGGALAGALTGALIGLAIWQRLLYSIR
jgi:hypothetical protein